MQRVRQFGQLRDSRLSERAQLSANKQQRFDSAKRNLLCVNCVNKNLFKQKTTKNTSEKQQQNHSASKLIQHQNQFGQNQLEIRKRKANQSYRMMTQYNAQIVRIHSGQKEIEKEKKLEEKRNHEIQRQKLLRESQNRAKRERLLKEKWFQDLKQQMAVKQEQKQRETQTKMRDRSTQKENILSDLVRSRRNYLSVNYKKELQQQIKANQLKKEAKDQQRRKQDITFDFLLDRVEDRQNKLKKQQQDKKRLLLEEGKLKERELANKRKEKELEDIRVREQIAQKERNEDERRLLMARMRQNRMSEYIKEVKEQINYREVLKRQQKQAKMVKFQETFATNRGEKQKVACNSCEKQYPKSYLSQFQTFC